jgi:hypothetical protein
MREIFTYGSVGGAPGNRCFYPEIQYHDIDVGAICNFEKINLLQINRRDQNFF